MSEEGGSSGGHGGPVWLLTYCDLITLLVAFFVMLISFATINVDKYKKDMPKIEESFDSERWADRFTGFFDEGEMVKDEKPFVGRSGEYLLEGGRKLLEAPFKNDEGTQENTEAEDLSGENSVDPEEMYNYLSGFVKESGLTKYINIEDVRIGCKIKIPIDLCFEKGESALKSEANEVFCALGSTLKKMRGKIVVDGNAGNARGSDRKFSKEVDVSLDRAAGICDFLATRAGIGQQRIAISGYHGADAGDENAIAIMIFRK